MSYQVNLTVTKSGAVIASIIDDADPSGTPIKEVYSHFNFLNQNLNVNMMKRHIQMLEMMGKL